MTRAWTGMTAVTLALYVGAAALLVPAHGLDGAVWAYVAQWAFALVVTVALLGLRGLVSPNRLALQAVAWSLATAAVAVAVDPGRGLAAVLLVAFVALLPFVGTTREERAALIARVRGTVGRLRRGRR
jgi:hypothetical protein